MVEQVDPGVHRFQVGDEVYGMPYFPAAAGANAEYLVAPARQLARKPAGISHEEAAALPLVGLTAWHALVQLAKHLGAEVIGTASASKHDFLRGLGADQLVDYRTLDYTEVLREAPVDVVLETLGGGNAESWRRTGWWDVTRCSR